MKVKIQSTPKINPAQEPETELESLFLVIILNDEVTPMNFVVQILTSIFYLNAIEAEQVMLSAHQNGAALVQVLAKSEAEKRVGKAHSAARLEGYPLQFSIQIE